MTRLPVTDPDNTIRLGFYGDSGYDLAVADNKLFVSNSEGVYLGPDKWQRDNEINEMWKQSWVLLFVSSGLQVLLAVITAITMLSRLHMLSG